MISSLIFSYRFEFIALGAVLRSALIASSKPNGWSETGFAFVPLMARAIVLSLADTLSEQT